MGHWFQYGRRSWEKMPHIAQTDIERYSEDWWKWWCKLQPSFRGEDPRAMSRVAPVDVDVDWSQLLKGGPNGIFIVLITLGWWSLGVRSANGDINDCFRALADVQWVLEQLQASFNSAAKRPREMNSAGRSTSKNKR